MQVSGPMQRSDNENYYHNYHCKYNYSNWFTTFTSTLAVYVQVSEPMQRSENEIYHHITITCYIIYNTSFLSKHVKITTEDVTLPLSHLSFDIFFGESNQRSENMTKAKIFTTFPSTLDIFCKSLNILNLDMSKYLFISSTNRSLMQFKDMLKTSEYSFIAIRCSFAENKQSVHIVSFQLNIMAHAFMSFWLGKR